ncbi:MAG: GIY-YIG nuclease family protein [Ectothiorhodospiraceae bacterium AqS1]|nr:GIY-YIG nuclease family protein [Ectothiorhodospiraceae bacterium AqS1]
MTKIAYILTNPAFPNLIKIGRTENLERRIHELSAPTGVPAPFECYFACEVADGKDKKIESLFKTEFAQYRFSLKREFYEMDPERVKRILELMGEDITPASDITQDQDDADTLERARSRRPVFRFSMVNIPNGAELAFIDDENIICRVSDDRKVEFEGKEMSLNKVTLRVLKEYRNRNLNVIRGPSHWLFEGETLRDRRIRLEQSDDDTDDDTC